MKKIEKRKTKEIIEKWINTEKIKRFGDFLFCKIKYKASSKDYKYFEMYKMSNFERKTYITKGKNNELIKKYNNPKRMKLLNNPLEYHKTFTKFLNREWIELNQLKSFKSFCTQHKEIIAYSNKKTKHIVLENKNIEKLYKELKEKKYILIEEKVKTTGTLKKISPTSDVYIKIITLLGKSLLAILSIEEEQEKIIASINIEKGTIFHAAEDNERKKHEVHPKTKKEILGITIPNWEHIKETCELACLEVPEIGYIEWTFAIGEKRICLIHASATPSYELYQRVPHLEHDLGIVPIIKQGEERKIENENSNSK